MPDGLAGAGRCAESAARPGRCRSGCPSSRADTVAPSGLAPSRGEHGALAAETRVKEGNRSASWDLGHVGSVPGNLRLPGVASEL